MGLLDDLKVRTRQRVIRADDPWIKDGSGIPAFGTAGGAIKALRHDTSNGLWVELEIG